MSKIFITEYTQNEETMIDYAHTTLDAAMQAAKQAAEEVKLATYDDDVVIEVDTEQHLVYFVIDGQDSEEQWLVREIDLLD